MYLACSVVLYHLKSCCVTQGCSKHSLSGLAIWERLWSSRPEFYYPFEVQRVRKHSLQRVRKHSLLPECALREFIVHWLMWLIWDVMCRWYSDTNSQLSSCRHSTISTIVTAAASVTSCAFEVTRWDPLCHVDDRPINCHALCLSLSFL